MSDISAIDPRVSISSRTTVERSKLQHGIDDFASFTWASVDMWQSFGAFIINEKKGSLKFSNGPSFKNNYTKQQFMDGYSNITGVEFDKQTISFNIGVYWISIEDYRVLLQLLHPYEVNMLTFGFDAKYGYLCKLNSIKESTRYIVGKETASTEITTSDVNLNYSRIESSNQSGYRYYTELNLSFDVVGPLCARAITPASAITNGVSGDSINDICFTSTNTEPKYISQFQYLIYDSVNKTDSLSDLSCPFTIAINNVSFGATSATAVARLQGKIIVNYGNNKAVSYDLFDIAFKNIEMANQTEGILPKDSDGHLSLEYDSEHGLIYWILGEKRQLFTLLSTLTSGERLISSMTVNQCFLPGRLDQYSFYPDTTSQDVTTITLQIIAPDQNIVYQDFKDQTASIQYQSFARTNTL